MIKKFKVGMITTAFAFVASTCVIVAPGVLVSGVASAAPSQIALNLANEQGNLWGCAFNPFNPTDSAFSIGPVYETLDFVDALNNAKVTPWLASSYAWSNANKTVTFTIRSGAMWTDGTPLTAADVYYTLNLLKTHSALDVNALWSVLSSVSSSGNKVTVNFKTSAVPYFYYLAGLTPIVPKHLWTKVANPVTYTDTAPIGSGGYVMNHCTPQNIKYTANKNYWQKGMAQVQVVNYPAFLSNNTCNEYLAQGLGQWGSQFIPSIKTQYVNKAKGNNYWFPAIANVSIFPNLTVPGLDDPKVRLAMSYALNRSAISTIGEYGYEAPSNQTGIVTPTYSKWLSASVSSSLGKSYDVAKTASIMTADGYAKVNGVWTKDGKQLAFSLMTNGGYSDWVASAQVMTQQLNAAGFKITLNLPASTTFYNDIYTGNYQLAYNSETGGPSPYYEFRQALYSKNSAAIGTDASSNWERYNNPAVDSLLNNYAATTSTATQHTIINQLESIMATTAPIIPVLQSAEWFEFNATHFGNFPSPSNPYAQPALYAEPDWGYVVDQLKPKA